MWYWYVLGGVGFLTGLFSYSTLVVARRADDRTDAIKREDRVRKATFTQVQDCDFIGNVKGAFCREAAYENAVNELMDDAANLGASHVVLQHDDPYNSSASGYLRGEAFKCK